MSSGATSQAEHYPQSQLSNAQLSGSETAVAVNSFFSGSFLALSEALPQIVWFVSPGGAVEYVNQRWVAYSGLSSQASIGLGMRQAVHPSDLPNAIAHWRPALAAKEPYEYEARLRRKDGQYCWHLVRVVPIFKPNGEVGGWFGTATDIDERKQQEQRLHFLAEASARLGASLDYARTIQELAELIVPHLADWCGVDILSDQGTIEQVAVAHVEPAKVEWARNLRRRYPVSLADPRGVAKVIRTGQSEFYPTIPQALLAAAAVDDERSAIIEEIGFRSVIVVPLTIGDRSLGALTLVWSDSPRYYTEADLDFAEEFARRAAWAIHHAWLFEQTRQAEQRQAETLAQLESMLQSANIGFAYFDAEHRYVRINELLASINGLPVEAHLGRRLVEVLPINAKVVDPILDYVFETGQVVNNLEVSGETPKAPGVTRHWLTSYHPITDNGQRKFVGVTVLEITERRQFEDALRESEERFRTTFEQAAVGMAHKSLDGRWMTVNDRLCEIVGYTRAELLQLDFTLITHPDDLAADLALAQQLLDGEIEGYELEKRYIHHNGTPIWVQLTVSLRRSHLDHQPQYFIVVVEDISKRKAAESRLALLADFRSAHSPEWTPEARAQAMLNILVPRFADWALVNLLRTSGEIELAAAAHRDADGVAHIWTLAAQFPLPPLALNGEQGLVALAADGTPNVIATDQAYFRAQVSEAMFAQDARLARMRSLGLASLMILPLTARGQTFGALTLARTEHNRHFEQADLDIGGELARRLALSVDNGRLYQESRRASAELSRLAATLEQRVAERTAELEQSNRELDQFAYIASHDLRAPLRAIENLSAWIEEDSGAALPAVAHRHLERLRGRVQRMERLLDDLLEYSRAGRVQHQPEVVMIQSLISEAAELQGLPPRFSLQVECPVATVRTVRVPLETIFRNLIGNAVKHHNRPDGRIRVTVSVATDILQQEETSYLRCCVNDDGPGIAPEFHARIFEMFQTLQPRDQVEGSGIGLSIVKKIVESVGGSLTVESTEGEGATFCFTWPFNTV